MFSLDARLWMRWYATHGFPVYVISLRDSEVGRRNMTERLAALRIPLQFVDAIDGRTGRVPDLIDGAQVMRERVRLHIPFNAGAAAHSMGQGLPDFIHRSIKDSEVTATTA
jgi:hypothetical protein